MQLRQLGGSGSGVPRWQASAAYVKGAIVLAPDGTPVAALRAFTSAATYDATKWVQVGRNLGITDPRVDRGYKSVYTLTPGIAGELSNGMPVAYYEAGRRRIVVQNIGTNDIQLKYSTSNTHATASYPGGTVITAGNEWVDSWNPLPLWIRNASGLTFTARIIREGTY